MTETVIKTKRKPTGAAAMGAGPGRPKGCQNKVSTDLKKMIMEALGEAGGVPYLVNLAHSTPTAFASLLGKVLPMTVTGADGGDIGHRVTIEVVGVAPPG